MVPSASSLLDRASSSNSLLADEDDSVLTRSLTRIAVVSRGAPARDPAEYRGYLLKMAAGRRLASVVWHRRYLVLRNGTVEYYREWWDPAEPSPPPPKSQYPLQVAKLTVHSPARVKRRVLGRHGALSIELEAPPSSLLRRALLPCPR